MIVTFQAAIFKRGRNVHKIVPSESTFISLKKVTYYAECAQMVETISASCKGP